MEISTDFYSQSLFLFFVIKLDFLQLNVWIFPSFRLGFELTLQRPGGPYGPDQNFNFLLRRDHQKISWSAASMIL